MYLLSWQRIILKLNFDTSLFAPSLFFLPRSLPPFHLYLLVTPLFLSSLSSFFSSRSVLCFFFPLLSPFSFISLLFIFTPSVFPLLAYSLLSLLLPQLRSFLLLFLCLLFPQSSSVIFSSNYRLLFPYLPYHPPFSIVLFLGFLFLLYFLPSFHFLLFLLYFRLHPLYFPSVPFISLFLLFRLLSQFLSPSVFSSHLFFVFFLCCLF